MDAESFEFEDGAPPTSPDEWAALDAPFARHRPPWFRPVGSEQAVAQMRAWDDWANTRGGWEAVERAVAVREAAEDAQRAQNRVDTRRPPVSSFASRAAVTKPKGDAT